jgi:hypothetical protein
VEGVCLGGRPCKRALLDADWFKPESRLEGLVGPSRTLEPCALSLAACSAIRANSRAGNDYTF